MDLTLSEDRHGCVLLRQTHAVAAAAHAPKRRDQVWRDGGCHLGFQKGSLFLLMTNVQLDDTDNALEALRCSVRLSEPSVRLPVHSGASFWGLRFE
jgi:hypothetical protein